MDVLARVVPRVRSRYDPNKKMFDVWVVLSKSDGRRGRCQLNIIRLRRVTVMKGLMWSMDFQRKSRTSSSWFKVDLTIRVLSGF